MGRGINMSGKEVFIINLNCHAHLGDYVISYDGIISKKVLKKSLPNLKTMAFLQETSEQNHFSRPFPPHPLSLSL